MAYLSNLFNRNKKIAGMAYLDNLIKFCETIINLHQQEAATWNFTSMNSIIFITGATTSNPFSLTIITISYF
jgi:hypothetical protein